MNLMHDWIDRNTPSLGGADTQPYDRFSDDKRKDVRVDRVLEEFLRDTMVDLLLEDPRIAELGEVALSRLGNAQELQKGLLDLLNTYYQDLADEYFNQSSILSEIQTEGRHQSHEVFSAIAPCWIYEVKKSRTYIAEKVVARVIALDDSTKPQSVRATTDHLIRRTQREWRHRHDKDQVEAQVRQVLWLLTEGAASKRLKEDFRKYLFPGSWTTHMNGNRLIISHEGSVLPDVGAVSIEGRKDK
jgi:uncharacterized membrane-anchored protein YjiN (DUF445 family)